MRCHRLRPLTLSTSPVPPASSSLYLIVLLYHLGDGDPKNALRYQPRCITPLPRHAPTAVGRAGRPACGATLVALYANCCVLRGEEVLLIDPRFSRSGASFLRIS